jgi:hypothetical protein
VEPKEDPDVIPRVEIVERVLEVVSGQKLDGSDDAARGGRLSRRAHAVGEGASRVPNGPHDELSSPVCAGVLLGSDISAVFRCAHALGG